MRRIAYLSYSSGQHDARTMRMARSAIEAGYAVSVYARWEPGLPVREPGPGYEIVRVPADETWLLPGAGGAARRRWRSGELPTARRSRARDRLTIFPLRPMGWARALDEVAEPADLWHGMWAGSLPALDRLRARHGGRTIYDSRDIYMRSRGFERLGPLRAPFAMLERRWARRADRIITVNDAYARVLADEFDVAVPPVIRNTPPRYTPSSPRPDLLRHALGVGPETRIVLYQGGVLSDRGIEQGMDAILAVPDALFAIMGVGGPTHPVRALAASARYRDKVRFVDPVAPDELLDWTASADVSLMAIQPTSLNHRLTTPQKLWESIAAGVPVVASDLPGMADVVREIGAGALVDPTDPGDIARGIREVVDAPEPERLEQQARILRAAAERYAWEAQVGTLLGVYAELLGAELKPGA